MNELQKEKMKILVVDDDRAVLDTARDMLESNGFTVVAVDEAMEALEASADPDLAVACLDIVMPNYTGLQLLKEFKRTRPELEVVMMTGFGQVESAVEAMKAGAADYLCKPFSCGDFVMRVTRAAERKVLRDRARGEEKRATDLTGNVMIGQSLAIQRVCKLIETMSQTDSNVLIQGESGTGKELVARAIHNQSSRRDAPFVAINCSALTDSLLESEFFGHVKGSFTGALSNKKGLFEAAHHGTIFLDEIGDVSPATQVRLLRVLQEGEVRPVGANESTRIDVRIIAATNVDLARAMETGRFREDLYYRLNVLTLKLPALRERPEDIPALAYHFLRMYSAKLNKPVRRITEKAMEELTTARWTGNVRELENAIERGVVLSPGEEFDVTELPHEIRNARDGEERIGTFSLQHLPYAEAKKIAVRAFERRYLSSLLEKSQGNVSRAARDAGIDRSNFRRLLKQFGVMTQHWPSKAQNFSDDRVVVMPRFPM